jgi:hypothetical protein
MLADTIGPPRPMPEPLPIDEAPGDWSRVETRGLVEAVEEQPRQKLSAQVIRLSIVLLVDATLIAVAMAMNWVLASFLKWTEGEMQPTLSIIFLRRVGSWFIFALVMLHLLRDLTVEIRSLWRALRAWKLNA